MSSRTGSTIVVALIAVSLPILCVPGRLLGERKPLEELLDVSLPDAVDQLQDSEVSDADDGSDSDMGEGCSALSCVGLVELTTGEAVEDAVVALRFRIAARDAGACLLTISPINGALLSLSRP
jgi:hypothetical protein